MQGFTRGDEGVADDGAERIPDLSKLPQDQWLDALRPLSFHDRIRAQNTLPQHKVGFAIALVGELMSDERAARVGPIPAPPIPIPVGDPPPRGPRRQVNFRLGPGEHARLLDVAGMFAMRPNTLARLLVVRGVDRALRDARRGDG